MRPHFYIGLAVVIIAEILLFTGVPWVSVFFTPIVWTGYILLIDAIVFKIRNKSWLITRRKSFLLLFPLSAGFWYIFEFFNLFIRNWSYEGLPAPWIAVTGMTWAFATIGPGMLETADLLQALNAFRVRGKLFQIPKPVLYTLIVIGIACLIILLIVPSSAARNLIVLLWLGFLFLFDPINCLRGRKSILRDWQEGKWQFFFCLFLAGLICGFLWEFWNYWAQARWVYQVPYAPGPKIFEMPLLGFLGFPPLALEYYAFYSLVFKWKH